MQYLKSSIHILFAISIGILLHSCIDPFEIETIDFNSTLVVEGTITDKNETQRIMVSKTFPLDTVLMSGLSDAKVEVKDSNGSINLQRHLPVYIRLRCLLLLLPVLAIH